MPTDLARIKTLFQDVLERPASERVGFLQRVCAGDTELRAELEALLRDHEAAAGFLAEPTGGGVGPSAMPIQEGPGSVIGNYKLLQEIGEGGFGRVFMAQQERPVRRRVALKIIKLGMDTKEVIARFEAERQALALMDHPYIAKVLDAGSTDSGRPYFVMELIKGVPITEYCNHIALSTRERLTLFTQVCRALQHAHQKGIIHRDVKPGNVLVTLHDGVAAPKVIDFGVAKATDHILTEKTLFTEFRQLVGTPDYMSPEQAEMSDMDVDTRSDIYSLGVLLYELLTGSKPLDVAAHGKRGYGEIVRHVRDVVPPKPSTRVSTLGEASSLVAQQRQISPEALARTLAGEIDWIVMKALDKDRSRRYESAEALAVDIENYLAARPVEAGPPSRLYRTRKFVQRHRTAVTAGLLVVAALIAGATATVLGLIEAREQRTVALRERDAAGAARKDAEDQRSRAQASLTLAMRALNEIFLDEGERRLVRSRRGGPLDSAFLERGLVFYEALAEQHEGTPKLRLDTANAHRRVSAIRSRLGRYAQAATAIERALEILDELPADVAVRALRTDCEIERGRQLREQERWDEAEKAYGRALLLATSLAEEHAKRPGYRMVKAKVLNQLGVLFKRSDRPADAMDAWERALALRRELVEDFPDTPAYTRQLAQTYGNVGVHLCDLGRLNEAEAAHERAIEYFETLDDELPENRESVANAHYNLAVVRKLTGRLEGAEQSFGRAIDSYNELAGAYAGVPHYRRMRARARNDLAILFLNTDRVGDAAAAYRLAIDTQEQLVAGSPSVPAYRKELTKSLGNLAIALARSNLPREAQQAYERALSMCAAMLAARPRSLAPKSELASLHDNYGVFLARTAHPKKAEEHYLEAIELHRQLIADAPHLPVLRVKAANTYNNLGWLCHQTDRPDEAAAAYGEAVTLQQTLTDEHADVPEYRRDLADTLDNLGTLHYERGVVDKARKAIARALVAYEELVDLFPERTQFRRRCCDTRNHLVHVLLRAAQFDEAERAARENLARREALVLEFPKDHTCRRDHSSAFNTLGEALYRQERWAGAEHAFRSSLELMAKLVAAFPSEGSYQDTLGGSYINLGLALGHQDRLAEARGALRQAEQLQTKLLEKQPANGVYRRNLIAVHEELVKLLGRMGDVSGTVRSLQCMVDLDPKRPGECNHAAWLLANCEDLDLRDPKRAVGLALQAVEHVPQEGAFWNTLGVAHYRAGNWTAATEALRRSMELRSGGDAYDWFFLAMAHQHLGESEKAIGFHRRAEAWADENGSGDDELRRVREEARGLMKEEARRVTKKGR